MCATSPFVRATQKTSLSIIVSVKKGWNTFIPHYLSSLYTLERRDPLQAERRCRPYWLALWEARPPGRSLGRAMSCLQRTVSPTRPPAPILDQQQLALAGVASAEPGRVGFAVALAMVSTL